MAIPSLDTLDIISPDHYQQHGYPHEEWTLLRREAPLLWYTRTPGVPFWAVTKYQDIITVSKQPRRLLNSPRLGAFPEAEERAGGVPPRNEGLHLLSMDPPEHGKYRRLISKRFTPSAIRQMRPEIEEIAREILDGVTTEGEVAEIDFVTEVSAVLPLAVIAHMLGVPRSDWKLLFQWTNQMIGSGDPEYRGEGVGSYLFKAAETWAIAKGCKYLKIETQNVNAPACLFYQKQGCVLGAINTFAYPDLPGEICLMWYKDLTSNQIQRVPLVPMI